MVEGVGDVRVIGFSMNTDAKLGELMHKAAAKAGMKHVAWVRAQMIKGVRDAGFEYVAEDKVSLKEQLAQAREEAAELRALLAAAKTVEQAQQEAADRVAAHKAQTQQ